MARREKKFPGVSKAIDRHGKSRWRLRRTIKGRKIDCYLDAVYGSEEFRAQYEAAIAEPDERQHRADWRTIGFLIEDYLGSKTFSNLAVETRYAKRLRLDWIRETIGHAHYADLLPRHVATLMDRKGGLEAANRLHKELAQLYKWAAGKHGYTGANPTTAIERHKVESDGFHTWTYEQVGQFRDFYATGTKERLAFELVLGTGAARQDAARMGPLNIRGGVIRYVRGKTGGKVELPLAKLPDLARELSAITDSRDVFVSRLDGKPYTREGFGNWFAQMVQEAGLPTECRVHALRKHGAMRLAEAGATEAQIAAFLGHRSHHEARRYIAAANRQTLASSGLDLLKNLPNLDHGLGKTTLQVAEKKGTKS
ncbi:MAG TPA: integrase [Sulfitobacter sp.]|nr:integrase [Sulfitobacter sp.]|tara:strand:+ start:1757 stop:2860 length:1104 start_codon:yes stop_codon:yes gene_type:complete